MAARRPPRGGGKGRRPPASGSGTRSGSARSGPPRSRGPKRSGSSGPPGLGGDQVEGRQAVREALLGPRTVREILVAADMDPAPILDDIRDLAHEQRVAIRELKRSTLEAQARSEAPQGVVAMVSPIQPVDLEVLAAAHRPFLLVLDGLHDPQNLGAILRTAEAAGVTGVVLPRHRSVRVTAAVTKTAAGAVEWLPMAVVAGVPTALTDLKAKDVWVVGLDQDADQGFWGLSVANDPVALVLGSEGSGLARLTRERCDVVAALPLAGRLGSLNVSAAAAVACYEIARLRQGG
ncbi:MAG: 23S rRNA (guanosine(2251)-2'-O)-methyltransferase RlmB [Acidimicrobiales bacterium]